MLGHALPGRGCFTTLCFLSYILHVSAQCSAGTYGASTCTSDTSWQSQYGNCPTYELGHYQGNNPYCVGDGACPRCCECSSRCQNTGVASRSGCTTCPQYSTSPAGSTVVTQCTCNSGYTGPAGGPCVAAAYRDCQKGYESTSTTVACRRCDAGKYKAISGTSLCISCDPNYSSSWGASTCMLCTGAIANAQVVVSGGQVGNCACNKGYYGTINDPGCDLNLGCDTYYNAYGGGGCTACAAGKYYWQPFMYAYTNEDQCQDCPSTHPYSLSASTTCSASANCDTGRYLSGTSCVACAAGTYKAVTGTAACDLCPAGSTSAVGSTSKTKCSCNAGFVGGFVSVPTTYWEPACADHPTYRYDGGDLCDTYAVGHPSGNNQYCGVGSTCQRCCASCRTTCETSIWKRPCQNYCWNLGPNTSYTTFVTLDGCTACAAGKYKSLADGSIPGECVLCAAGKYSAVGSADCSVCAAGKYSAVGSAGCSDCPAGKTSAAGATTIDSCYLSACDPGYTGPDGGPCVECAAGTYKAVSGSAACNLCPAGKTSTVGQTVCVCQAGYAGYPYSCDTCGRGKYSLGGTAAQCTECLDYGPRSPTLWQYGSGTGASACFDCYSVSNAVLASPVTINYGLCVCNEGYYGLVRVPGRQGDATVYTLAQSGGVCYACPAGKYDSVTQTEYSSTENSQCTACPAGKTSAAGATTIDSCFASAPTTCATGQYLRDLSATSCVACDAGKYKTTTGTEACSNCADGQSSSAGAIGCFSCQQGQFTSISGGPCQCDKGWTGQADHYPTQFQYTGPSCSACLRGTYKDTLGSVACTPCPFGSDTSSGASVSFASCICMSGYLGSAGGPCTACAAGKYEQERICLDCPANTYSAAASTSLSACLCNSGYEGPAGGPCASPCNAGFTGPAASCTACVAGKYKTSSGSAVCTNCGAGKYSTSTGATLEAACLACPSNSNSASGSAAQSSCACNAGFTGPDGGPCSACPANTYKNTIGSAGCTLCTFGAVSPVGSTSITQCQCDSTQSWYVGGRMYGSRYIQNENEKCASFEDSSSYSYRICGLPARYKAHGIPEGCPAGFTQHGHSQRQEFVNDYYSSTLNQYISVKAWISYYVASKESTLVWCHHCSAVNSNSYKAENGCGSTNGLCSPCPAESTVQQNQQVPNTHVSNCTCGSNKVATMVRYGNAAHEVSARCACKPGYVQSWVESTSQGTNFWCNQCPVNTYTPASYLTLTCPACPPFSSSPAGSSAVTQCTCNSGYEGPAGGPCVKIECNAGFTGPDGGTCTPCAAGKYKSIKGSVGCTNCEAGKYAALTASFACTLCPAFSTSAVGISAVTQCTCDLGFTGSDAESCTACAAGKYKTSIGSALCTDCTAGKYSPSTSATLEATCLTCPSNSNSPSASVALSSCTCNLGFTGLDGGSCAACVSGKYKTSSGSDACSNCGAGKYSTSTAATLEAACLVCAVGKFSTAAASVCTDCAAGSYAAITGSSECTKCPANSSSPSASIASTACQCSAGFSGPNAGPCTACAAGSYKGTVGTALCTLCGTGKYSTATGQSSSGTCQDCLAGKYSTATGQSSSGTCQDCSAGKYSTLTGQSSAATCQECVAGKFSTATGQSSSATCQNCLAGTYAALTGSTVCENCLAGKFSPATGQSTAGTCQDCFAGKFNSATAQSSCQDCPALSSSAAGSSECFCNPGYWDSYVSCKQCPLGKYRDHLCLTTPCAENTCLACLSGTYARTPGQSACTKCPVGKVGKSGISA